MLTNIGVLVKLNKDIVLVMGLAELYIIACKRNSNMYTCLIIYFILNYTFCTKAENTNYNDPRVRTGIQDR